MTEPEPIGEHIARLRTAVEEYEALVAQDEAKPALMRPASSRCRLFHDWSCWETCFLTMVRWNGTEFEEQAQSRHCVRCGKMKIKRF